MHIFFDDKIIKLTSVVEQEAGFKNYLLRSFDLESVLYELKKSDLSEVRLVDVDQSLLFELFLKKIKLVKAAGGIVVNPKGETLFIFRNNKWDLPKGRLEKNESLEVAAVREVEEETGVKDLSIVKHFKTTYHIFKRNGVYKLKETYWYEMTSDYSGELFPQLEEGITDVKWKNKERSLDALDNSYRNIKHLLQEFYSKNTVKVIS